MRTAQWMLVLALALALAAPGLVSPDPASAQSAGDEQYVDPFQENPNGTERPGSGSADGGGGGATGGGGDQGTQVAPPSDGDAGATQDAVPVQPVPEAGGNGAVLPRTGLPLPAAALAGAALLIGGAALRRKT